MAVSLSDILTVIQNGVVAFNNLASQVTGSFNNIASQLTTNATNTATNTANIASLQAGPLTSGNVATQANQETATSVTLAVTPGRQQFHPSAAKAWAKFAGSGVNGAQTVNASYNVSGVSRTAAGTYTVSFSTAFSSADYAALTTGLLAGTVITTQVATPLAGSIVAFFANSTTGAAIDPTSGFIVAFGDQP